MTAEAMAQLQANPAEARVGLEGGFATAIGVAPEKVKLVGTQPDLGLTTARSLRPGASPARVLAELAVESGLKVAFLAPSRVLTDNSTTLACDYEITTDSKSATELKADISNKTSDTSFLDAVSQSLESELQSQGITVEVAVAISSVGIATTAAPTPPPS